jgi:lipoate-protein ligase A
MMAGAPLLVWHDPLARSGPENMALDETLLENLGDLPVLRIYGWKGDWISLGYFQRLAEARRLFPDRGVQFVRRMTGGGIVDHRRDLTYSLLVPRGLPMAEARGDESYRRIHQSVVETLQAAEIPARMLDDDDASDSAACFEHGVAWDVVGKDGRKLAGAGQKRSRAGLLHQGSILIPDSRAGVLIAPTLAASLAAKSCPWSPDPEVLQQAMTLAEERYATMGWLERR